LSNNDVIHDCIDNIVSDLQKIFVITAKFTFGYMSNKQRSTDHNKNPWFDNTCIKKREMSSTELEIDIDLINLIERRKS